MLRDVQQLIDEDLDYIIRKGSDAFDALSGSTLWFTGSAGFIGYYLCKAVARFNAQNEPSKRIKLLALDNYSRGVPEWLNDIRSDEISTIKHDVVDPIPADWPTPNYIIHGASIASPMFYRLHPLETIDANVDGLRRYLDYAAEHKDDLAGMLYFSTSEIYGDPPADAIPTDETFRGYVSCTGPRACYDESKRLGETLCVTFAQVFDLPVKMARPFNNYGPGLKLQDGRVLPDFTKNALEGQDIVMLSDGAPTRTFCYIADSVVGYLKILTRGGKGEPYNIGIEKPEISMRELADTVVASAKDLWGYEGQVVLKQSEEADYLTDNPQRRCPDITKARTELDYNPEILVDDGITRALNWYYYNRGGAVA